MMNTTTGAIRLSDLPTPQVIEPLDFDTIAAELRADFLARYPDFADAIGIAADPINKLLETAAYREVMLRGRINDAARATMLPYAVGADLDNLVALLGVERKVLVAADPAKKITQVLETDDDLRHRAQQSLHRLTTAGSKNAYRQHALAASDAVLDVAITSPRGGEVQVSVLSAETPDPNGTPDNPDAIGGIPSTALLKVVADALNAEEVRPLTDTVEVVPVAFVPVAIEVILHLTPAVQNRITLDVAKDTIKAYITELGFGEDLVLNEMIALLMPVQGVLDVIIAAPADNTPIAPHEMVRATRIIVRDTLGHVDSETAAKEEPLESDTTDDNAATLNPNLDLDDAAPPDMTPDGPHTPAEPAIAIPDTGDGIANDEGEPVDTTNE